MKKLTLFFITICIISANLYSADASPSAITLKNDGFPTGHETPEGVACDLARALISNDSDLFTQVCLDSFVNSAVYINFLKMVTTDLDNNKKNKTVNPLNPKMIGKVYAARHLSKEGPGSYGYAVFDFQDVMFVDIGVFLNNNKKCINRTFVIKKTDNKWYVLPCPDISPLLSDGLNEESPSTIDFKEKYKLKRIGKVHRRLSRSAVVRQKC